MRNTTRLLAALLTLIAGPALAQNLPANTIQGRLGIPAGGGPAQSIPFAVLKAQIVPPLPASPTDFGAIPDSNAAGVAATNQTAFAQAMAASKYIACNPGQSFYTQSITIPVNTILFQNCHLFASGTYGGNTAVLQVTGNASRLVIDSVLASVDVVAYPTVNGINLTNTTDTTIKNSSLSGNYPILLGRGRNTSILNNLFESTTFGRAVGAFSDGGGAVSTATLSIASPMVVTKTAHGLSNDDTVILYSTGALPTGAVAGRVYYVVNASANTFQVSQLQGGTAINSSGSQSGTHSYISNGPQALTVSGNTLIKSTVVNSQGIVMLGVSDALISSNNILGSTHFAISASLSSHIAIVSNVIKYSGAEAIHTDSGVDVLVAGNNLIFDATSADVAISVSSDNGPPAVNTQVVGNLIDSPFGAGIYFVGSTGGSAHSNKIRNANVGNSSLSASIILDGPATTNNLIGQNTIEDTLGFNAYQVGESNYTGGGTPSANYIAQQLGVAGTSGYILNVATTETAARSASSPSSSDTKNGFQFGSSRFALRDLTSSSIDLFDFTGTLVASLGNGTTDTDMRVGQTSFTMYSRGFAGIYASIGATGWKWTNVAAPSSPAAGSLNIWGDSTNLRLHDKNSAGVVGTTVVGDSGAANNFLTAVSPSTGVISKAQPSAANLSNGTTGTVGSAVVLQTSPTLTTPVLGIASASSIAMNVGSSFVAGPSIGNGSNTLLLVGGTSGFQWNNQTNGAALFTMTNAGAVAFSTYGIGNITSDASGNLTSTRGQLYGVSSNTAATAGNIGELITATLATGSAVSLVTGTAKTITSVSLTAGEWDVSGTANYVTGATTTVQSLWCSISSTNNTLDATLGTYANQMYTTAGSVLSDTNDPAVVCPTVRKSLSTTTTIFLIALSGFGTSTNTAAGFIRATRVH